MKLKSITVAGLLLVAACGGTEDPDVSQTTSSYESTVDIDERLARYTSVELTADLSGLTEGERQMIPLLIEAADAMNEIFWQQSYGDREELLGQISDPDVQRYVEINYGPWDRLEGNEPFIAGVGPKPLGANFYPADMTREEFEAAAADDPSLTSLYTLVRRDDAGELISVPYSEAYRPQMETAAARLREAAELAEDAGLRNYLNARADALLSDEYRESEIAWLSMTDNTVEVLIGPIETYEDQLFGYKAAAETFVLIKDREWSQRLERYAELLPMLQRQLPVGEQFKSEQPGTDAQLNAYDAIYYAGDANAGSKTIAINLPNDEEVQLNYGTRRLQLKNSMRAKFDEILVPIADVLIDPEQRQYISFDAFFENTMFHEVAHGLGIKNTINDRGTVREALRERASALEEGKADVLGLFMVTELAAAGELEDSELRDNYVTFIASIFRSVRFGASSAHGLANVARFNYFQEAGAFTRDPDTGTYSVNFDRMQEAIDGLSELILTLQGEGDYDGVGAFMDQYGHVGPELESDLARLSTAGIPVDIVFEQGMSVLE